MRDLDALGRAEEVCDVLADHITATHRRDADLAAWPRADVAVARVALDAVVVDAAAGGDRACDRERRTRRCIALRLVMALDDLGVPLGAEDLRGLADEAEHEVDAEREVRRDDHRR